MSPTSCVWTKPAAPPICFGGTAGHRAARASTTTPPAGAGRPARFSPRWRVTGLTAPGVFDGAIDGESFRAYIAPDPGADPAARRHRHGRHSRGPQGRRHPTRHPGRRGHPLVLATLQARTSIPSSSASRSSRPSFAPLAVAAPRRSGRSSASAWRTSALTTAATMFGTAGTRPPHGHEKRFSLRLGLIGRWVQMTRSEERRSIAPLRPPFRGPPPAHELPAGSVGRNGSVQRYTRRSDGRRTRWCRGAESNCRHHDFQTCAEADQNRSDRVFTC